MANEVKITILQTKDGKFNIEVAASEESNPSLSEILGLIEMGKVAFLQQQDVLPMPVHVAPIRDKRKGRK